MLSLAKCQNSFSASVMTELTLYSPRQIRKFLSEYQQIPKRKNTNFSFYEFLKEKLEIEGYWKKVGLA
jgi:hypothetical protein